MASTILEQILENVRGGATLPARSAPATATPPPGPPAAQLETVAGALLDVVDGELRSFLERSLDLTILRRLPLGNDSVREQVVTRFSDLATSEIVHVAFSTHEGGVGPAAPRSVPETPIPEPLPPPDFSEAALQQIREMLAPIHDLPRLLEERDTSSRDGEILEQLGSLSRDLHNIQQPPSNPTQYSSGPADPPPAPEAPESSEVEPAEVPRVSLDDIQKMIDFLK